MNSPFPQDVQDNVHRATLIARVSIPGFGAVLALATPETLYDLSSIAPTSSDLLAMHDPAGLIAQQRQQLPKLADMQNVLENSTLNPPDLAKPYLLAPCDLQPIKAAGVTFVASMLERVIEEQARGDASKAVAVREKISKVIGDNLRAIVPSPSTAL